MHAQKTDRKQKRDTTRLVATNTSQTIAWYHPGQSRTLEVGGVKFAVRFTGRRGRRARIAITAPAGATISAVEQRNTVTTGRRSI